jgi:hypothetical protein
MGRYAAEHWTQGMSDDDDELPEIEHPFTDPWAP